MRSCCRKPLRALNFKRKVNLRIIGLTAFTTIFIFSNFIFLYFTASRITTSLFALDHEAIYVKREALEQLSQIFQPEYKSYQSRVSASLFAQQNISVILEKKVGNTQIDKTEINVAYRFGKPVHSAETMVHPSTFFYSEDEFSADSKALLAFKDYPYVQGMTVMDVVIW